MSTNVTIRDIDTEIQRHRQEIAKHRLWISQLEDTKLNMMQLAEIRAAENGHVSPFGRLPDGMEIAVKEQLPAPAPAPAKKEKQRDYEHEREMAKARRGKPDPRLKGTHPNSRNGEYRERVIALLQGERTGMLPWQIADRLDVPGGKDKERKALSNALASMLRKGMARRDQQGRYILA